MTESTGDRAQQILSGANAMPSILMFEDKVYYDYANNVYAAVTHLRLFLNLDGELSIDEDTDEAYIGKSMVLFNYVEYTTLVVDLNKYSRVS